MRPQCHSIFEIKIHSEIHKQKNETTVPFQMSLIISFQKHQLKGKTKSNNNGANTHPQNRVVIQAMPVMGLSASPLARKWSSFHRLCHCLATYIVMFDWLMIAYIALFSALLSRLTVLAYGSTWVTSFIARFFKISTEVVYLQHWHGWCHMKLQPSRRQFCVHHTTMLHVTSCKATCVCASTVAEFQPSSYM